MLKKKLSKFKPKCNYARVNTTSVLTTPPPMLNRFLNQNLFFPTHYKYLLKTLHFLQKPWWLLFLLFVCFAYFKDFLKFWITIFKIKIRVLVQISGSSRGQRGTIMFPRRYLSISRSIWLSHMRDATGI